MTAHPDRVGLMDPLADVFERSSRDPIVRIEPASELSGACPLRWDCPPWRILVDVQDPAETSRLAVRGGSRWRGGGIDSRGLAASGPIVRGGRLHTASALGS
jgi:hypothetical protein